MSCLMQWILASSENSDIIIIIIIIIIFFVYCKSGESFSNFTVILLFFFFAWNILLRFHFCSACTDWNNPFLHANLSNPSSLI